MQATTSFSAWKYLCSGTKAHSVSTNHTEHCFSTSRQEYTGKLQDFLLKLDCKNIVVSLRISLILTARAAATSSTTMLILDVVLPQENVGTVL